MSKPILIDGVWYCEHDGGVQHRCVKVNVTGMDTTHQLIAEKWETRYWGCPSCRQVYVDQFGKADADT